MNLLIHSQLYCWSFEGLSNFIPDFIMNVITYYESPLDIFPSSGLNDFNHNGNASSLTIRSSLMIKSSGLAFKGHHTLDLKPNWMADRITNNDNSLPILKLYSESNIRPNYLENIIFMFNYIIVIIHHTPKKHIFSVMAMLSAWHYWYYKQKYWFSSQRVLLWTMGLTEFYMSYKIGIWEKISSHKVF